MAFGQRKGGSSIARAARAKRGHARRQGRLFATQQGVAPYKGARKHRTKRSWIF